MAYDSETYGKSPFGNSSKPDDANQPAEQIFDSPAEQVLEGPIDGSSIHVPSSGELDQGPGELSEPPAPATQRAVTPRAKAKKSEPDSSLTPTHSTIPDSVTQLAHRLGLAKAMKTVETAFGTADPASSARKSRTTPAAKSANKPAAKKRTKRKSKKEKAAELAQAEAEAAEAEVARRFREEDRSAYLSLLYKTGISGLVWAVLRLSRHELSDDAVSWINVIIHPLLVAVVALCAVVGLTLWMRRLLTDLAYHTRQLNEDAETSEGKNYRPTLEIVGDALAYNPKLRRNLTLLFDAASILICTLISYLITSALLP